MKVAYLKHQFFATASIDPMLRSFVGHENVIEFDPFNISPETLKGIDILSMPGIYGEKSPYPDIVPPETGDIIMKAVHEEGMLVLEDCAFTYWSGKEIEYHHSDGSILRKQGLNWVDATMKGPLKGPGISFIPDYDFSNVTTVQIEFYDQGETHYTRIPYSNSPTFYLSEQEANNPAVEIIARFSEHPEKPVAAMTKKIGNGMIIPLGVLPQLKWQTLRGHFQNPTHELHRAQLQNEVQKNHDGMVHFERILCDRISKHLENTGRKPLPIMERQYA